MMQNQQYMTWVFTQSHFLILFVLPMIVEHIMSLFVHYAPVILEHCSACLLPGINHEVTGHGLSMNLAKFLKNFGTIIPENKEVKVHDSNADMRYLVLPERPSGTENWDEEELSKLISRDHLVGIRVPTLVKLKLIN